MKAVAASSIGQYENSVRALDDYYRTVEMGLGGLLPGKWIRRPWIAERGKTKPLWVRLARVVFGSDQGLVGQFNEVVDRIMPVKTLAALPGKPESGPSVSAFMRAWRTRACHSWDASPCRTPLRRSPRLSDRFSWRARRTQPGGSDRTPPFLQPPYVRTGLCARQSKTATAG